MKAVDLLEKWETIPEALRWILCWPAILLPTWVANYVPAFLMFHWDHYAISPDGTPNSLSGLFQMVLGLAASYFTFFYLLLLFVPRAQDIVAAFWTLLFVLLGALLGVSGFLQFQGDQIGVFKLIGVLVLSVIYIGAAVWGAALVRKAVRGGTRFLTDVL